MDPSLVLFLQFWNHKAPKVLLGSKTRERSLESRLFAFHFADEEMEASVKTWLL